MPRHGKAVYASSSGRLTVTLAVHYSGAGFLQEAIELLIQLIQSDECYAVVYKNLSRIYVEMSRNAVDYSTSLR